MTLEVLPYSQKECTPRMFADSPLLRAEPDWTTTAPMSSSRACVEQKRSALAELQLLPAAEQPKSTILSIENEIRAMEEQDVPPEAAAEAPGVSDSVFHSVPPVEQDVPPETASVASGVSDSVSDSVPPVEQDVPPETASVASGVSDSDPPISKELARQMRQEVATGKSARGRPLSQEEIGLRLARLHRRVLVLPARYRQAELARLSEAERRFVGHLEVAVGTINDHTTETISQAVEPLLARAEGRVPPRRPDQTATERKIELQQILAGVPLLREERRQCAEEERQERRRAADAQKAERQAERAAKKARIEDEAP